MYIADVPNRTSPPATLLRESYREGTHVKTRTLANLSHWPRAKLDALRQVLRGKHAAPGVDLQDAFEIVRTRPHGHVAAVVGKLRQLGLNRMLSRKHCRERELNVAMIASRLLAPRSKLATARGLDPQIQLSTLGEVLGIEGADEDELYEAMDWLLPLQESIEDKLAAKHLSEGTLALYDVSSTYFEGRKCPLAKRGHNRDGKKGKLQIVFGLICNKEGCPVAIEVFEGNTGDPKTVASQVKKVRERFKLVRLVMVGDRGMLTTARIRNDLKTVPGIEWITALRAPAIKKLVKGGSLQLSVFDQKDLAEVSSPDFPGERLMVCRNPLLADQRGRNRRELLDATEKQLAKIVAATQRTKKPLRGKAEIGQRVGAVIGRFKMKKHFSLRIRSRGFSFERKQEKIDEEAALDGIYVVRTVVPAEALTSEETVRWYKRLASVERAFRSMKTVDIKVRPVGHWKAKRVKAHVFQCMLAYYVEWHMRRDLAPLLFDDDDKKAGEARRSSVVAPAKRSERAEQKARTKRTEDGEPVHSFQTLLSDLATIAKNRIQPKIEGAPTFDMITTPTSIQKKALDLLGVVPKM